MSDPERHEALRLDPSYTHIDAEAFVAQNATVIGDVHIGAGSSVWFGTIIRGDTSSIRIGARTNLQDGTVVHADPGFPCTIGDDVTVGHRCIIHGATIGPRSLIGMHSTVMNGAQVGEESIIGAGSLVTERTLIPPRSLAYGSPARVIRPLTEAEIARTCRSGAHYVEAGRQYRQAGYGLRVSGGSDPLPTRRSSP